MQCVSINYYNEIKANDILDLVVVLRVLLRPFRSQFNERSTLVKLQRESNSDPFLSKLYGLE
jgi:hypothetical protein